MKASARQVIPRLVISASALALVVFFLQEKLKEAFFILLTDVNWAWFLVAVAAYIGTLGVLAVRLKFVFQAHQIRMTFGEVFYLGFIGLFFNLFLPSAVGGDIAKIYYAYKHSGKKLASTTSVVLDRLLGFVAMILLALLGMGMIGREFADLHVKHVILGGLGGMLLVAVFFGSKRFARLFSFFKCFLPSRRWKGYAHALYHAIYDCRHHKGMLALCLALSFVSLALFIMIHYWIVRSLGVHMNAWLFFILVPTVAIVSMAPSMGGLGVREAGITYLFSRYIPTERALALSLLVDALIYGFSFLGGIFYAVRGELKPKIIHEMEALEQ